MLAGVMAMVRMNSPRPAARRVAGIKIPAAPNNSNTPLISTIARGIGKPGGTMRISMSVAAKCAMPPIRNHRNTATKAIRRSIGVPEAVAGAVLGPSFIGVVRTGGIIRIHQAPAREAAAAPKALQPRRQPHPFGSQPQRIARLVTEHGKHQRAGLFG